MIKQVKPNIAPPKPALLEPALLEPALPAALTKEERLVDLQSKLAEVEADLSAISNEKVYLQAEIDKLIVLIEGEPQPHSNQLEIMRAIARSQEVRAARVNAYNDIVASLPHPTMIRKLAPIDSALGGRKRQVRKSV